MLKATKNVKRSNRVIMNWILERISLLMMMTIVSTATYTHRMCTMCTCKMTVTELGQVKVGEKGPDDVAQDDDDTSSALQIAQHAPRTSSSSIVADDSGCRCCSFQVNLRSVMSKKKTVEIFFTSTINHMLIQWPLWLFLCGRPLRAFPISFYVVAAVLDFFLRVRWFRCCL